MEPGRREGSAVGLSQGDAKVEALRAVRCLNRRSERVTAQPFLASAFFDARDLVQVKYEMVRHVRVGGASVSATASAFGFSRPTFYKAAAAFDDGGVPGLLPRRPGPRGAYKLTDEVVAFVEQLLSRDPSLGSADLAAVVLDRFSIHAHPRSVERALDRSRRASRQ